MKEEGGAPLYYSAKYGSYELVKLFAVIGTDIQRNWGKIAFVLPQAINI